MNENINYEIEQIEKYLQEIGNLNIKDYEDFKNTSIKYLASSMCVFSILNSCIELGENLIQVKNLETPLKYREIFEILSQNKIISKNVCNRLIEFMFIRNMLAHQYGKINQKKLFLVIENLVIFEKFISEVKKVLSF